MTIFLDLWASKSQPFEVKFHLKVYGTEFFLTVVVNVRDDKNIRSFGIILKNFKELSKNVTWWPPFKETAEKTEQFLWKYLLVPYGIMKISK